MLYAFKICYVACCACSLAYLRILSCHHHLLHLIHQKLRPSLVYLRLKHYKTLLLLISAHLVPLAPVVAKHRRIRHVLQRVQVGDGDGLVL